MGAERPTVVFFPEGAYGPTNNCIGIGRILRERGARVVFVVEESFAGTLEAKGFEERLMRLQPPPEKPEEPGQFWKDFIANTAPHFRESTFEQIQTLIRPIWQSLIDGAIYVEPRLQEIFAELRPDVIVEDNVVAFPAVVTAGCPWVRIVSCNPLEIPDPELPPALSGLPTSDRSEWDAWREEYWRHHADLQASLDEFVQSNGAPPLPERQFIWESPYLNLYLYPEELDYQRSRPLASTWHRLDSSVRDTEPSFTLPEQLQGEGKLIYVSLGSLGSAEPELMNRLVRLFAATPHRVIISLGPQKGQIALPGNIWGDEYLPQPSILPLVDAVVTHGGNNTTTECMHFGKPMLVLPLFWDQHDNAQRLHECGAGYRLDSYGFSDDQFYRALDDLLGNEERRRRLQRASARIQAIDGRRKAADAIERLAREKRPLTRSRNG
jgi:MGT family glycosyltransferase